MNTSLKLTIAWLLLLTSTILSYFVAGLDHNGLFVSILALKKFLLVGFIYLEGIHSHWLYRIILIIGGCSLLIGNLIWRVPGV
jgi:hypothetical protein